MGGIALRMREAAAGVTSGISDSFNRADNTSSLGTTDTGQAWTAHVGTFGIVSNQAYSSAIVDSSVATVDAGAADLTISALVTTSAASRGMGLAFRVASGGGNYYVASFGAGGILVLKYVAGALSALGSTSATAVVAGDTISATCAGSSITVRQNGTTRITLTDSTYLTQTRCGIWIYGTNVPRFDDLTVV